LTEFLVLKSEQAAWGGTVPRAKLTVHMNAGRNLHARRDALGLTVREVEAASKAIASRHGGDSEYLLSISQISYIESRELVPNIFKVFSLSIIYRLDYRQILDWYGISLDESANDLAAISPPKSHTIELFRGIENVKIPVRLDPSFDFAKTCNLGRMIEKWGIVPLSLLGALDVPDYSYAYLGSQDVTMYPILLPGSLLQVDETKTRVTKGPWRTEYERPIYFVELREEFMCCWCEIRGNEILLQPHPQSGVQTRVCRNGQEAEVIGQVVGVAMRLDGWTDTEMRPEPRQPQLPH
jgi:transcriptional regulator with XRE-family HTH domain